MYLMEVFQELDNLTMMVRGLLIRPEDGNLERIPWNASASSEEAE